MQERQCAECGRMYRPSSGHKRCPSCRSRNLCECGNLKHKDFSQCAKCRTEVGAENSNWRGGRTRHHAGYLMVYLPGHPRATTGRRYVFEHILVAEEMLGRPLHPSETVHHRNGVRDDNRPENLEIWTKPQPSGIRASDAIAWASEILERYEGPGARSTIPTEPRPSEPGITNARP